MPEFLSGIDLLAPPKLGLPVSCFGFAGFFFFSFLRIARIASL
jgi:hypothetical protein